MKAKPLPLLVVDYGLGNLLSITRALRAVGAADVAVSCDPAAVASAEKIVLPGVGAFGDGMAGLRERGLVDPLREFARSGRPLLGICLGLQLLFDEGEEFGRHQGLGIIPGRCVPFPRGVGRKVPHVGWTPLVPEVPWTGTLLDGLGPRPEVYFVHSYFVVPSQPEDRLASTDYAGQPFCSVARRGRVAGCQFHPEKSSAPGLTILKNFVEEKP
jgi:glutamine amidotransferase